MSTAIIGQLYCATITDTAGTGAPNYKGRISGSAVAAGYVGEIIAASIGTTKTQTSTADTEVDITGTTLSLTSGNWLMFWGGMLEYNLTTAATSGFQIYSRVRVTDSANTLLSASSVLHAFVFYTGNGAARVALHGVARTNISANTDYKLRMTTNLSTNSGSGFLSWYANSDLGVFTGTDNEAYFFAVRLP